MSIVNRLGSENFPFVQSRHIVRTATQRLMTAEKFSRMGKQEHPLMEVAADPYAALKNAIAHHLQNGLYERLDTGYIHRGSPSDYPAITGAVFLTVPPNELRLLIADARTSIALALQRHLDNQQFVKRLSGQFHYRVLRQYLSEGFRLAMVRSSNSDKVRFRGGRGPSLIMAYQTEIDRLDSILRRKASRP